MRTTQIHLNGSLFVLEEKASQALSEYLHSIQQYFHTHAGATEIMQDIENRIAEYLWEISEERGKKVIDSQIVMEVIQSMGTVEDIQNSAPIPISTHTAETKKSIKKLYRNPQDKVLGGVASGLAAYIGTDSTIVRVSFVLLTLVTGLGIILYLVLWCIVPEAHTISEQMQMEGEDITLIALTGKIEEKNQQVLSMKERNKRVRYRLIILGIAMLLLILLIFSIWSAVIHNIYLI